MFHWLRKKEPQVRLKEVEIGDGNMTVDLPWHFAVEQDEEQNTIVYDPKSETVGLRFSVFYLSDPKNPDGNGIGVKQIHELAKKHNARTFKHGAVTYITYQEPLLAGDEPGVEYYWLATRDNCVVPVSCWVSNLWKNDPAAKAVLNAVEPALLSLRESIVQKYKYEGQHKTEMQPLLPEHEERLQSLRQQAIDSAKTVLGRASFTGGDSDIQVIQTLLDHSNFDKSQTAAIEGMGVIFGGILARKLDLEWVSVTDEYGSILALQHQQANIIVYPIEMLIKRVERGEDFDVKLLFNSIHEEAQKIISSGKFP